MQTETLIREFRYNGARLTDPSPAFSLHQVRDFYGNTYPEIVNAEIEGPEVIGSRNVYTFRRAVGTKGAAMTLEQLRTELVDGTLRKEAEHLLSPADASLNPMRRFMAAATSPANGTRLTPPISHMPVLP
ncbi:PRTRC system protein C [Burkholderia cenocepacia]|uniref:PRTRC system protein C n=1 Tax=Burkholderia cenocepacia TaxID=95486 RepID=UPI001B98A400|nr:PRTRC system protein C [Burkholderia cenocepacia]MBR8027802.1 PRTRC system protein C [Burkholderia cenocepacia]MBR8170532.1 PRTRC system protein C [Burkholderia cenocepacia]